MRAHVLHLGHGIQDRALDLLPDPVRSVEVEVARELQVERDLDPAVDVEHREVVDLAHVGDAERGRERPLADAPLIAAGLDVDDDVDVGQPLVQRRLHAIGGGVPLAHGGARRDPDHDIREVAAARLADPEPPQLDGRVETGDRAPGLVLRVERRAVHEDAHVPAEQADSRDDHQGGDEERGEGVAGREARRCGAASPTRTANVPTRSLPKWRAFASRASLQCCLAVRSETTVRDASTASTSAIAANVQAVGSTAKSTTPKSARSPPPRSRR